MTHKVIFVHLVFEMIQHDMSIKELAAASGLTYVSLRRKMRDEAPFLLKECIAIKQALKSDMPLETLFEKK